MITKLRVFTDILWAVLLMACSIAYFIFMKEDKHYLFFGIGYAVLSVMWIFVTIVNIIRYRDEHRKE